MGRSITTVAPNRPPANAASFTNGWAAHPRGRSHGERAAAEVVARRRGQVGDERGDILVAGRVAGQDGRGADRVARPLDRQRPRRVLQRRAERARVRAVARARAQEHELAAVAGDPGGVGHRARRDPGRVQSGAETLHPAAGGRERRRGVAHQGAHRPQRGGRGGHGVLVAEVALDEPRCSRRARRRRPPRGRRHPRWRRRCPPATRRAAWSRDHTQGYPAMHGPGRPSQAREPAAARRQRRRGRHRDPDAHGRDADPAALLPAAVGPAGHRARPRPADAQEQVDVGAGALLPGRAPDRGRVPHRHRAAARGLPRRARRARTARRDRLRHPHGGRLGGHRSARRRWASTRWASTSWS